MITLHHYYLCSSSRYIRLILEEHNITYETQLENFWKPQKDFLKINPAGHLPVLVNEESFPDIEVPDVSLPDITPPEVDLEELEKLKKYVKENLRNWFKKEKWKRIDSQGNIAGDCGTMKKGKPTQRCLP